jgi:hypothetical protein
VPGERSAAAVAGASADDAAMTFRVADPGRELAGVRVLAETGIPGDRMEFRLAGDCWELALDRPPVSRLEYLLELRYPDGGTKVVTDRASPRQVAGASGPKSVLEFPGYAPPAWLSAPADPGRSRAFELPVASRVTATAVTGMGTSLGAPAMLPAYCRYPGSFTALFQQSGSFHARARHGSGLPGDGGSCLPAGPVPAVLTGGAIEENVAKLLQQVAP